MWVSVWATTVLGLLWVTETPNGSAWTDSRYSFAGKSIVVQPGLSWTLLSVRFSESTLFLFTSPPFLKCVLSSWSTVITSIFMFQKTRERSKKAKTKTRTHHPSRKEPWPFHTFLLTSYWPELSHMATPSCKGAWEMLYLSRWPYDPMNIHYLSKKGENWPWGPTNLYFMKHLALYLAKW